MIPIVAHQFLRQTQQVGLDPLLALQQACIHCPQAIQAVLERHPDAARHRPVSQWDRPALMYLLDELPKVGFTADELAHRIQGIQILLKAGADPVEASRHEPPPWHRVWAATPVTRILDTHDRYLAMLADFMDHVADMGVRWEGQTFLHAFARRCVGRVPVDRRAQLQALVNPMWDLILQRCRPEDLKAWAALSPFDGPPSGFFTANGGMEKEPPLGILSEMFRAYHLSDQPLGTALTWAERFLSLGADPHETCTGGDTAAHHLARAAGWELLEDDHRGRVAALGLDFGRPNANGHSAMAVLRAKKNFPDGPLFQDKAGREALLSELLLTSRLRDPVAPNGTAGQRMRL